MNARGATVTTQNKRCRRMNILFVSDDNLVESVVYDIHILAEALSLRGHNVFLVGSQRGSNPGLKLKKQRLNRIYHNSQAQLISFGAIKIPVMRFLYSLYSSYRTIYRVIQEENIDVIVLYSVVSTGAPALRLAKKFNIPVIFRNIDMLHRLFPSMLMEKVIRFFEKKVYARADRILALTPNYADYLINLGALKSKVRMLYFPIDFEFFNSNINNSGLRAQCKLAADDKVIVFMGYLYNFSELIHFVYQFPRIIEKVPKTKLLIVGDGPLRSKLEQTVMELGLENCIRITGLQPFKTMPQYIHLADVCINPYPVSGEMKDLFCAKLIQYMACSQPVVSSSLPGIASLLRSELCGICYVKDMAEMADEVISILSSSEKGEKRGEIGFKYVKEVHNKDKIVSQLEEYLSEAII